MKVLIKHYTATLFVLTYYNKPIYCVPLIAEVMLITISVKH